MKDVHEDSGTTDPDDPDSDGDGIGDMIEMVRGTDPMRRDSDRDGKDDLDEVDFPLPGISATEPATEPAAADTGDAITAAEPGAVEMPEIELPAAEVAAVEMPEIELPAEEAVLEPEPELYAETATTTDDLVVDA
jgi:hypothetical protein